MMKTLVLLAVISVFFNAYAKENTPTSSIAISDSYHSGSAKKPGGDTANKQSGAHLFSLSTGYSRHIERDDAISPFIYNSTQV